MPLYMNSIGTGLFVKIPVAYYKTSPSATPTSTTLRFSDYIRPITINGEEYIGLGNLVGISGTSSQLKSSSGGITITISGIPNSKIAEIVNSQIKGCSVEVWRAFFDVSTGQQYSSPAPVGRFFGIVTNYALNEEYDVENRTATNTIDLICSSRTEMLDNKVSGRRTNPKSWKIYNPNDVSMDRVPNLVGANFDFGVPK